MNEYLKVKASAWLERTDWGIAPHPRPRCDMCGEPLPEDGSCDAHHWLVRRSHVPKSQQDCIHHRFNIVLLHRSCHERADGMKEHFRAIQAERYGESEIQEWLGGLPLKVKLAILLSCLVGLCA